MKKLKYWLGAACAVFVILLGLAVVLKYASITGRVVNEEISPEEAVEEAVEASIPTEVSIIDKLQAHPYLSIIVLVVFVKACALGYAWLRKYG